MSFYYYYCHIFQKKNILILILILDCKGKSSILKYRVLLSAYIKKFNLLVELTIALMCNVYAINNGPKIDPLGFSVFTSNKSDSQYI